jgi:hypothetical protein
VSFLSCCLGVLENEAETLQDKTAGKEFGSESIMRRVAGSMYGGMSSLRALAMTPKWS